MPDLMTPGRLADLVESPEYKALSAADQSTVLENGAREAHDHVSQTSGWTPELWQTWGQALEKRRSDIAANKSWTESAGDAVKVVGGAIGSLARLPGMIATGLSPVLPDGKPGLGVAGQVPGETLVPMMGANIAKLDESIAGKRMGGTEAIEKPLEDLKAKLAKGEFPMNDAAQFSSWLDQQNAGLQAAQRDYYTKRQSFAQEGVPETVKQQRLDAVDPWVKSNDLSRPENAKLLNDWLRTRNDSTWDQLRKNLLTTPAEAGIDTQRTKLSQESTMAKALKPELRGEIKDAADPLNALGEVGVLVKGAKALGAGTKLAKAAQMAEGAAMMVGGSQAAMLRDDPNATPEQRWAAVKDSLIAAVGLGALGAGVKAGMDRISAPRVLEAPTSAATEALQSRRTEVPQAGAESLQPRPASLSDSARSIDRTEVLPPANAEQPSASASGPMVQGDTGRTIPAEALPVAAQQSSEGSSNPVPVDQEGRPFVESAPVEAVSQAAVVDQLPDAGNMVDAPQGTPVDNPAGLAARSAGTGGAQPAAEAVSQASNGGPGASSIEEWGTTRFGQRIAQAAPEMKGAWAKEFNPVQYRKRTFAEWEADSRRFVREQGLKAADLVFDPESGLEGSDRVALAGVLMDEADRAAGGGDAAANALATDLADWLSLNGSKAGQETAAYGFLVKRDPRLIVEQFRKKRNQDIEDQVTKGLGTDAGVLADEVAKVTRGERDKAVAETEAAVTASPVIAAAESDRAATAEQRKQAMQDRADALLGQYARSQSDTLSWPGKKPPDPLRELMREHITTGVPDFMDRAQALGVDALTAERLMQVGTEETRRIAGIKTAARLAREAMADQAKASGMVDSLAREFSDTLSPTQKPQKSAFAELVAKAKREEVPDLAAKLAALKMQPETARQLAGLLDEYRRRDAAVKDALKRQAEADGPQNSATRAVDQLARQFSDTPTDAASKPDAVRSLMTEALRSEKPIEDVAQRFEELGVKPGTAAQLAKLIDLGRKNAEAVAREKAGQKLMESLLPKVKDNKAKKLLPPLLDKLMEAERTGVLGRTEFLERYAETFGLPKMTPEVITRLTNLAREARLMPEGLPKIEKVHELQNELAVFGGVKARDALMSAWYANMLSGVSTQGVNVWGNAWSLALRAGAAAIASPKDAVAFTQGLIKGLPRGLSEAANAIRGGRVLNGVDKIGEVSALEALAKVPFGDRTAAQKVATLISVGTLTKYGFRVLSAVDGFFHGTSVEGRAHLAASRAVRAKGLKVGTPEYWRAIQDDLGLGVDTWKSAQERAAVEAKELKKDANWIKRRTWDLVEREHRDVAATAEARHWADIVTYQGDPQGTAGVLYDVMRKVQDIEIGGVPVARPFVPFARVLANVFSANLDLTPIGIWRGVRGKFAGGKREALPVWDARERIVLGAVGSLAMATLGGLAWRHKDENDVDNGFMVYGAGPTSKAQRDQMPKGWRPFTIKWGNKYWSYAETPMGLALTAVGAYMDSQRYGNMDGKEADERLRYALGQVSGSLFSQGMLSSMGNLFDVMKGDKSLASIATSYAGGLIPAQGLLRDINTAFDPTKISATDIQSALLKDVPVVRNIAGKPDLNVWGDPVRLEGLPVVRRFVQSQRSDDLSDWLGRLGVKVPALPQTVEWAQFLTPGEKFAEKANRIEGGMLTPAERWKFAKRSGEMLKERVKAYRKAVEGVPVTKDVIQNRVEAMAIASRRVAMREIVGD